MKGIIMTLTPVWVSLSEEDLNQEIRMVIEEIKSDQKTVADKLHFSNDRLLGTSLRIGQIEDNLRKNSVKPDDMNFLANTHFLIRLLKNHGLEAEFKELVSKQPRAVRDLSQQDSS